MIKDASGRSVEKGFVSKLNVLFVMHCEFRQSDIM